MQTDTSPHPDTDDAGEQLRLDDAPQAETTSDDLAAQLEQAQQLASQHEARANELSQYEQFVHALYSDDPEIRAIALDALGIEMPRDNKDVEREPEPSGDMAAPQPEVPAEIASQLQELQGWRQDREEAEQAEAAYQQVVADTAPIFDAEGVPDQAREVILQTALNMPGVQTPDGPKPDIAGAIQELTGLAMTISAVPAIRTAVLNEYKNSKSAMPAPNGAAPGEPAPNLDDRKTRLAYMAAQLDDR